MHVSKIRCDGELKNFVKFSGTKRSRRKSTEKKSHLGTIDGENKKNDLKMENRRNALIHTIPTHQGTEPPIHS
jgi:hypothetical protein